MAKKRKILTVIPARGGSKGIRRKNIRELNGHPLIYYAIRAAQNSQMVDNLIVSTDDEEIAEVASSCGARIPFLRPPELSTDNTTLILVMKHALQYFAEKGESFDAVMSLQPTNPLLKTITIDAVINRFHDRCCPAVATVSQVQNGHPYVAKRMTGQHGDQVEDFIEVPKDAVLFPRQKRETAYYFNGAIYLRDRELVENFQGRDYGLGKLPVVVKMDSVESIDINEMLDLKLAETIMREMQDD